jgi:4-alpha-glucanotransferase
MQIGRVSGVLLPLFSLRSRTDFGIGDFGAAEGFLDWMKAAGQKLWMLLPLLPTAPGDSSPYACRCAFGLNSLFVDLNQVEEFAQAGGVEGLPAEERKKLDEARKSHRIRYDLVFPLKNAALKRAFERFEQSAPAERKQQFEQFYEQEKGWLDSYAIYAAVSADQQQKPWWEWPTGLRVRDPAALNNVRERLRSEIRFQEWLQWLAHMQWARVREQAKARGVLLCGDEPFIIGQDSADVWANPSLLRRDARLGVPPDDFSATGQDWGLPYFDFAAMAKENYGWLRFRAKMSASYYDVRRVDHAVGYFRQWIRDEKTPTGRFLPADEPSQRALGERNFRILGEAAGIVAEDLGVIPPFVRQVLADLQLPGYRVMRWERDLNVYRNPRQYPKLSLATTGTHDTESLAEWWEASPEADRIAVAKVYPEFGGQAPSAKFNADVHSKLIGAAENSSSDLCVLPWQDVLGSRERVNLPGSMTEANWAYRMEQSNEELLQNGETVAAKDVLLKLTQAGKRV